MKLPPPTTIDDAEWIVNLGTVFGAILDQLALNPDTIKRLRNDELALVLHAQGVGLIAKLDLMGVAMDELMSEIDEELGETPEHS